MKKTMMDQYRRAEKEYNNMRAGSEVKIRVSSLEELDTLTDVLLNEGKEWSVEDGCIYIFM